MNDRTELTPSEAVVHRTILREFALGRIPTRRGLITAVGAAMPDIDAALRRLGELDLAHLDEDGEQIAFAYPFSARPRGHEVAIDGVSVQAMCAVDALGIPSMLGTAAEIRSRDPITTAPIAVTVDPDAEPRWTPPDAVVVWGAEAGQGASAALCCPVVNFFESPETATRYLEARPQVQATIASIPDALEIGRRIFGDALAEAEEAR